MKSGVFNLFIDQFHATQYLIFNHATEFSTVSFNHK